MNPSIPGPVVFVCLHGSAKSQVAVAYFRQLAQARGLPADACSLGVEPDAFLPPGVVAGLRGDGFAIGAVVPRQATAAAMAGAARIVSFGCDLSGMLPGSVPLEMWDDMPAISDGYAAARRAIVQRVEQLVERLAVGAGQTDDKV